MPTWTPGSTRCAPLSLTSPDRTTRDRTSQLRSVDIVELDDPSDPRLADYALLNDQATRRSREADEFFVAEGYISIDRMIDSGHHLRSVVVSPARLDRLLDPSTARPAHLAKHDVPVLVVDRSVLAGAVGFDLHRGVLASADRKPAPSVADIASSDASRVAVLVGLNDAENVGVIARAARALRIQALVLDPTCTDPYARRTVRVSMGEILHLPVARATSWPGDLTRLHDAGFETWAMTPNPAATDLWTLDPTAGTGRIAVVLGAEGPGLDADTLGIASVRVRIPIADDVDSLNVGHAGAIVFAALARNIAP